MDADGEEYSQAWTPIGCSWRCGGKRLGALAAQSKMIPAAISQPELIAFLIKIKVVMSY